MAIANILFWRELNSEGVFLNLDVKADVNNKLFLLQRPLKQDEVDAERLQGPKRTWTSTRPELKCSPELQNSGTVFVG